MPESWSWNYPEDDEVPFLGRITEDGAGAIRVLHSLWRLGFNADFYDAVQLWHYYSAKERSADWIIVPDDNDELDRIVRCVMNKQDPHEGEAW